MSTVRVARRTRYLNVDKRSVNDERLSFKARGVLCWLLAKPDDWKASADSIATHGPEGLYAVRTALRELETLGYLVRRKWRGDDGKWYAEHLVYEHPDLAELDADHVQKPHVDHARLPDAGDPPWVTAPHIETGTEERTEATPTESRAQRCCELHRDDGCCDPNDCGPCCESCPTCPALRRGGLEVVSPGLLTTDPFELFWNAYPRHTAKEAARRAWAKAAKRAETAAIIGGAVRYRHDPNREDEFTKHPATWLNGGCWEDEPLPARSNGKRRSSVGDDTYDAALRFAGGS